MAKVNSQFEELARDAAANVQAARDAGQQLTFLPDEPVEGDTARKSRGKNKAISQLRDHLAAKGFRMPEDVLVEMAGMASGQDAFMTAIARTEQLMVWLTASQPEFIERADGSRRAPPPPSITMQLETFRFIFTAQIRAAEAVLPYGLGKVTPDVVQPTTVQIVMPAPTADRAAVARDITPRLGGRMVPADVAWQMQQNQGLSDPVLSQADDGSRTE